ncbi:MAG TPA: HAD-IC family P-type ATPase [Thermoplasmata archaeon]|nr:HAD-IC family P-type ATPase [Thermoplasmata archaeon]
MSAAWHSLPPDAALQRLESSPLGLSREEAASRLARYGPNELVQTTRISPLRILLSQFTDVLVIVLIIAAVISAALGLSKGESAELLDAALIVVIVILNATLGFVQEYRAERSLQALKALAAPKAHVVREGETLVVPARELVPGDIVLLAAGDRVPADARLLEASGLRADEASLTGESLPVTKTPEPLREDTFLADRRNLVFLGTSIEGGRGKAVVVGTGMQTELGTIAGLVQQETSEETPLQRQLDRLGKQIGAAVLAVAAVVFLIGVVRDIRQAEVLFLTAVGLAVAAIPEGLPAVVTISLALGLQRMVKRHALVRKLPAVEALGSATIICSDKTGTLTKGEMNVRALFAGGREYVVQGEGFDPSGAVVAGDGVVLADDDPSLREILVCGVLCNDAVLKREGDRWTVDGDATEGALTVAARRAGLDPEAVRAEWARVAEIPFTSERKKMSTLHARIPVDRLADLLARPEGERVSRLADAGPKVLCVKGAPERVLAACTRVLADGEVRPLEDYDRKQLLYRNQEMATRALRVLALARREFPAELPALQEGDLERDLTFLGLVGMMDAPRHDATKAIDRCTRAGIRVVMITGDHKLTAMAVAREMGILSEGELALTGEDLERMSQEDLVRDVEKIKVYARVSPAHKLRIVDAWKKKGHVVAMTGDGVNDAPALKRSDLGVAMGITGTDVAKESADMVLTDDNFASIVAAVEEGRGIYDNIRKFVRYMLSTNSGEVLTIFLASVLFWPLPLLPLQILWINLITDGFPALALTVEPKESGLMERKPRDPKAGILSGGIGFHIAWVGSLMAVGALALFQWAIANRPGDPGLEEPRTLVFFLLTMFQVFHVLAIRVERTSVFKEGFFRNRHLILAVLGTVALQLLVIYAPFLQPAFRTRALPWEELLAATLVASSVFFAVEFEKWVRRRREP